MITIKANIVHRNGKDYLEISDVSSIYDISNIEIDLKYQNNIPLLNDIMKRIINANWRIFKDIIYSKLDKFIAKIIKSFMAPLCVELALQDFFQ